MASVENDRRIFGLICLPLIITYCCSKREKKVDRKKKEEKELEMKLNHCLAKSVEEKTTIIE